MLLHVNNSPVEVKKKSHEFKNKTTKFVTADPKESRGNETATPRKWGKTTTNMEGWQKVECKKG